LRYHELKRLSQRCRKRLKISNLRLSLYRTRTARQGFNRSAQMDEVKKCAKCKRGFIASRSSQKFCSVKCRRNAIKRKRKRTKVHAKFLDKVCPVCGKTFNTNLSHKIYCSEECYLYHKSKAYTKKEESFPTCPYCLKKFMTTHTRKKYCSNECYLQAQRDKRSNV